MANEKIRDELKAHNMKYWELADTLQIGDSTLSRKLRHELPDQEQAVIIAAIKGAAAQRQV